MASEPKTKPTEDSVSDFLATVQDERRRADCQTLLYFMPGFGQMGDLLDQLGKYKTGKSCLYIKRLSDVDESVLRKMMERSLELMSSHRVTS